MRGYVARGALSIDVATRQYKDKRRLVKDSPRMNPAFRCVSLRTRDRRCRCAAYGSDPRRRVRAGETVFALAALTEPHRRNRRLGSRSVPLVRTRETRV
jgi:hypothetical protein